MNIIYLHGFLSSTQSKKAEILQDIVKKHNHTLYLHSLYPTEEAFSKMTLQNQVKQLKQAIQAQKINDYVLVGSSYGGLISLNFLATYSNIEIPKPKAVLLLAPALDFPNINIELLKKPVLTKWKNNGEITFYHPGIKKELPLHYEFYLSLQDSLAENTPPPRNTTIIHGTQDTTVSLSHVKKYHEKFPYVKLVTVNDDHRLLNSSNIIETELLELINKTQNPK